MSEPAVRLGVSGHIARLFQANPLTPILAIAGLLLGVAATLITPREEEPQIDVTMANVIVPFPGADARQVEQLVATPLERVLDGIEDVHHLYSISRPGMAVMTVEFEVGVPRQTALVHLYNQLYSNTDWMPSGMPVGPVVVKPKGIDDVPVMAVSLWTDDSRRGALDLGEIAHTLENAIKHVPGTRDVYTIGAPDRAVLVTLDPARMAAHGITVAGLSQGLQAADSAARPGERVGARGMVQLAAGRYLADREDVAQLVLGLENGRPVRVSDVATVQAAADVPSQYVWQGASPGRAGPASGRAPAVTIAITKKPGQNASDITREVQRRLAGWRGTLIPQGVQADVVRDYGATAADKAKKLIEKLVFATSAVVLLVLLALGWRSAVVVGGAVVLTLALTLFASWAMGFTLNRVSLFALVFAIGILVDDAIVVVENIHRHMGQGATSLREAIPVAVDEVGGPTILATLTVIAALLPMAFVTGLMGPYMRPIPVNASVGMLISLVVAFVVTPWLSLHLLGGRKHAGHPQADADAAHGPGEGRLSAWLHRTFAALLLPFLDVRHGARRRRWLFAGIGAAVLLAVSLVGFGAVILKMLPFDNKSELQVVVDLPEGRTVEDTSALLSELAGVIDRVPEVRDYQAYAGTASPINFNGLVRQYYLREQANAGDLQINLVDKHQRSRKSHQIALALRPALAAIGRRHGASVKVVEVPPGPPVLSPIVAELYGPDYVQSRKLGRALLAMFERTPDIVDTDSTVEAADAQRQVLVIDRARAARLGVPATSVVQALSAAVAGLDAAYVIDDGSQYPRPIRLRLPSGDQASLQRLLELRVAGGDGQMVPLSALVQVRNTDWDGIIQHKDLLPVVYVTGDEAGRHDSPLYGMFDLVGQVRDHGVAATGLGQYFIRQPADDTRPSVKWDGEWQITYETFRDMGIAYGVGMVLIYLLVVAQFRSYVVPLIIMAPIPLTVVGVMPGHALLGAQFTATSMIGMIALAGIIVRNSILLVDFINHLLARGRTLEAAVIEACAVRAQPIALTALAAMAGALFILDDPIFNGLAIALLFGIAVSTLLTLVVIPLLYYVLLAHRRAEEVQA